jgi:hypothetical protein
LKKNLQEVPPVPIDKVLEEYRKDTYSYQELLADPLPKGVDPSALEVTMHRFLL